MKTLNRYPISIYNLIGVIIFICDVLLVEDIVPWWIVVNYLFAGVLCLTGLMIYVITYPFDLSMTADDSMYVEIFLIIPLSFVMGFFLDCLLRRIRINVYNCKL